eukprot:Colp12_sorted_trinity150504_noHs@1801
MDLIDFNLCAACQKVGANSECGGCKSVQYCDEKCQEKHWDTMGHKSECAITKAKRPLPDGDAAVALTGIAAGLHDLVGTYKASNIKEEIKALQDAKRNGRIPADLLLKVHENLVKTPVAEAALNGGKSDVWDNLLEDLKLWHIARYVLYDKGLPWLHESELEDATSQIGHISHNQVRPPDAQLTLVKPNGNLMHVTPPKGAKVEVKEVQGHPVRLIEAVWPDGRRRALSAIADSCAIPKATMDFLSGIFGKNSLLTEVKN